MNTRKLAVSSLTGLLIVTAGATFAENSAPSSGTSRIGGHWTGQGFSLGNPHKDALTPPSMRQERSTTGGARVPTSSPQDRMPAPTYLPAHSDLLLLG